MPGGSTQARISLSLSKAESRLPRFMLTAVRIGRRGQHEHEDRAGERKRSADRTVLLHRSDGDADGDREHRRHNPLSTSRAHQAAASSGSALGSAAKNCHSGLARSRLSMYPTLPPGTDGHDANARGCWPAKTVGEEGGLTVGSGVAAGRHTSCRRKG